VVKDAKTSDTSLLASNPSTAPTTDSAASPVTDIAANVEQLDSNITNAIDSLDKNLSEAITQLSTNLSSLLTPADDEFIVKILYAVLVVVIGAFSAYLFNFFHWKMVEKRNKVSKIGVTLSALISDLESVAVDYWIKDYKAEDKQQTQATEVLLKSKLRLVSRYIKIIFRELNTKKTESINQKIKKFGLEIFDLVTGDEFETTIKKASKQKATLISNQCTDVRAIISSLEFID